MQNRPVQLKCEFPENDKTPQEGPQDFGIILVFLVLLKETGERIQTRVPSRIEQSERAAKDLILSDSKKKHSPLRKLERSKRKGRKLVENIREAENLMKKGPLLSNPLKN